MTWRADDPQGGESLKIRWELVPYTRGKVLDIGCGPHKPFAHFTGVDNDVDAQLFGIRAKPDIYIKDAGDLAIFGSQSWDAVFSSHLLEHIEPERVSSVLREWWRLVKQGGYLVLYLPDEEEYPKIGEPGANTDHKWNVNYQTVVDYMPEGWDLIDFQKRNKDQEYSLFFVFKKTNRERKFSHKKPRPKNTCGVVRYGAFGDLMQASSVIAGLKEQGYHVTLYTSPPGSDVILHDPNIDRLILQDKDQVPNLELGKFWANEEKKYDKWVNLSESVEGSLLALPGRAQHGWSPLVREQMLGRNYLEFQHAIAGVPHKPAIKFYATEEEKKWARKQRDRMGSFVVLWVLAGSSVHKTWPYVDNVVASLMSNTDAHVVFTGGVDCKILETGWENESRVHKTSGDWSIRETLAFASEFSDCVIGPETGVLNAVACLPVPKIVFLSHSSHGNLTRDWVNTYPLRAESLDCKGRGKNEAEACHQLHYEWSHCDRTEDGVAKCQAAISAASVTDVLNDILTDHYRKAA